MTMAERREYKGERVALRKDKGRQSTTPVIFQVNRNLWRDFTGTKELAAGELER